MKKLIALIVFCIIVSGSVTLFAQDEAVPMPESTTDKDRFALEKAELDRPIYKDIKHDKTIAGRLPSGYGTAGLTKAQRDDIYAIQKEYNDLIALIEARILKLQIERDTKVDALLTEVQVRRIRERNGMLESERQLLRQETPPAARRTVQRGN